MLVLSRQVSESIAIGDDVRITVCRIGGGRVRLGIDAPAGVPIVRGELPPLADDVRDEEANPNG